MDRSTSLMRGAVCAVTSLLLLCQAAKAAEQNFDGLWEPLLSEDWVYRLPGPSFGDYRGIPLSAAGIEKMEDYDPAAIYLPENQCSPATAAYIHRAPFNMQLEQSADLLRINLQSYGQTRLVHLQNEPLPVATIRELAANDAKSAMGYSVGWWDRGMLVVKTLNMIEGYLRRNGAPHSEEAVMTEFFRRDGDQLTIISVVEDPLYLSEPFVRSIQWRTHSDVDPLREYKCEIRE